ncbi:hypothetical protein K504DRAFT_477646 [Pleomassaria siparia CBS 279.74]|uniref:DASH complex subunit Hsk3 like-domain-containing protein n=1 Tax=Pleomassaria siparia CBS 279.74 TaxID=1314801 RepID=A0A6G1K6R8_9PLEO|nr:hypothetical protein K504DRAFT_477646 [Pleomassaria siparia CBS 279.74]
MMERTLWRLGLGTVGDFRRGQPETCPRNLTRTSTITSLNQSSTRNQHRDISTMSNPSRTQPSTSSRMSTMPSQKPRQLSHLQAQLAQLTANVADLENLMRMTAVQAQSMRGLGGYSGGMFMAASKVLGEETVKGGGGGTGSSGQVEGAREQDKS